MLVLSRKESQRIRLGDSIVITIVKISGDKVRIGIDAPSSVLVLRDELETREPNPTADAIKQPTGTRMPTDSAPLRQSA